MGKTAAVSVLVLLISLTACGKTETPQRPGEQEGLLDTQQQSLERAKGVADTVRDQADQQRRRIDQAN